MHMHPRGLYLICKHNARGSSVYKGALVLAIAQEIENCGSHFFLLPSR